MQRFVLALLAFAMLSGCTRAPDVPAVVPEVPVETAPEPTYVATSLGTFDVMATAAQPQTFQATVPEGANNVTVAGEYTQANMLSLTVELAGCGSATYDTVVAASVLGSFDGGSVCTTATAGDQAVTVTVDGAYTGSVTLSAMVPTQA